MIINRLLHVLNREGLYQTCYHVTFAINNHDDENNASLKYQVSFWIVKTEEGRYQNFGINYFKSVANNRDTNLNKL